MTKNYLCVFLWLCIMKSARRCTVVGSVLSEPSQSLPEPIALKRNDSEAYDVVHRYRYLKSPESPATAIVKVSCIGDSITQGSLGEDKERPSFTVELQALLGPDKFEVTNFGIGSMTMLKDGQCEPNRVVPAYFRRVMFDQSKPARGCSYWDTAAWVRAQASKPNIVTIMMGTNDAKIFNWEESTNNTKGELYLAAYREMIHSLRSLGTAPQIFIMIPPPMYKHKKYSISATVVNEVLPALIKQLGKEENIAVIDIYSAFRTVDRKHQRTLTVDHCHPSQEGANIIATEAAKAILAYYHAAVVPVS